MKTQSEGCRRRRKGRVRTLRVLTFGPLRLPPTPVGLIRSLGLVLLVAFCVVFWVAAVATAMLGRWWGFVGVIVGYLCFVGALMCFSYGRRL